MQYAIQSKENAIPAKSNATESKEDAIAASEKSKILVEELIAEYKPEKNWSLWHVIKKCFSRDQ